MKTLWLAALVLLIVPAGRLMAQEGPVAPAESGTPAAASDWKARLDLPPDELQAQVVKILRTTNKAQINRYVGKVYDFKNVNPGAINNYFHNVLEREEGACYTFVGQDGESGKILVICPEYQIPYFDQLCKDLDRHKLDSAPGSKYVYKQLKHRSAADSRFVNIVRQYATANGVVIGDVETNAMFLFDAPSGCEYAVKYLDEYLDTPTPVVDIRVRIFEVEVNNDGTLGLDWEDYKNGPYQNMLVGVLNYQSLDAGGYTDSSNAPKSSADLHRRTYTQYGLIDFQYPSAYFDLLVEKGKARVVTETTLTTSSDKPAVLFTGEQVLYYAKTDNVDTLERRVEGQQAPVRIPVEIQPHYHNAAGVVVEALDTGVRLIVRPIVGTDSVDLDVNAAVISLLGFAENGQPLLASRQADTAVTVKNGQEVVLGGLTRERQGRTSYKIPILGKLPVIGWLFGGETEILQKTMLVMVIQPTVNSTFNNLTPADDAVMAQSTGSAAPAIPAADWGFDMWLLDSDEK
ncbi:MAG: hypothetical protein Kow0059_01980 [Candidatus Sumerlaeia bacterium]